ncbi:MAG: NAD(P)/FAD-dependent oxidoreductase [Planctomycetaceae bacterium]|nr:NAD(P)/FAD-dependent oxidoreductase [Planctomycetaceae bacterium]
MGKQLVIIGGGPAATNAIETIRQYNKDDSITLICDEPAHSRMALPYWLAGSIPETQTHTADAECFSKLNVDAKIGQRVTTLDENAKKLTLSDQSQIDFDELLIATGSRPLELPIPGADLPGVHYLWTLKDTETVLAAAAQQEKPRVVMIGAGFIGLIVLNAMFKRGWDLAVIERENHVLPRMLNQDAAKIVESWLEDRNIPVHLNTGAHSITTHEDGSKRVILSDGGEIAADIVIVATGVQPNIEIVAGTSLKTDHGILVDNYLRTNVPFIYAAGDVAQGPNLSDGSRAIHAIQPTAVDHGRVAGANMAGEEIAYSGSLSMNVLDVCGLQSASFGIWDDLSAEPITICNPEGSIYRRFLITENRITGAMFVGRANDVGMLTDVGMVKGIVQTQADLGDWINFLRENPFDIRRVFVGARIPEQLAKKTLLGRPTQNRNFRFGNAEIKHQPGPQHSSYVNTKS